MDCTPASLASTGADALGGLALVILAAILVLGGAWLAARRGPRALGVVMALCLLGGAALVATQPQAAMAAAPDECAPGHGVPAPTGTPDPTAAPTPTEAPEPTATETPTPTEAPEPTPTPDPLGGAVEGSIFECGRIAATTWTFVDGNPRQREGERLGICPLGLAAPDATGWWPPEILEGEPLLVTLQDADGTPVASQRLGADGTYRFEHVPAGAGYTVSFGFARDPEAESIPALQLTTRSVLDPDIVTLADGTEAPLSDVFLRYVADDGSQPDLTIWTGVQSRSYAQTPLGVRLGDASACAGDDCGLASQIVTPGGGSRLELVGPDGQLLPDQSLLEREPLSFAVNDRIADEPLLGATAAEDYLAANPVDPEDYEEQLALLRMATSTTPESNGTTTIPFEVVAGQTVSRVNGFVTAA